MESCGSKRGVAWRANQHTVPGRAPASSTLAGHLTTTIIAKFILRREFQQIDRAVSEPFSLSRVLRRCHLPQHVANVHLVSRFEMQPYCLHRSTHAKRFQGAAMRSQSHSATHLASFSSWFSGSLSV